MHCYFRRLTSPEESSSADFAPAQYCSPIPTDFAPDASADSSSDMYEDEGSADTDSRTQLAQYASPAVPSSDLPEDFGSDDVFVDVSENSGIADAFAAAAPSFPTASIPDKRSIAIIDTTLGIIVDVVRINPDDTIARLPSPDGISAQDQYGTDHNSDAVIVHSPGSDRLIIGQDSTLHLH